MALLKKINNEWQPTERPDAQVGDIIQVTDYRHLVRTGAAIIVDEDGREIPLPDQVFTCPICYRNTGTLGEFVAHVDTHKMGTVMSRPTPEPVKKLEVEETLEVKPETTTYDKRLAALTKAREARKAKSAS